MKKLLILVFIFVLGLNVAAKNVKPAGLSDAELNNMNNTVDCITKKMYAGAFLSPENASTLIGIKIKLDDNMLLSPDSRYAVIYNKLGKIYQKRGKTNEAIECYQAIIENFPDTALAPKAAYALKQMGINVVLPQKIDNNTDEEE